LKTNSGRVKEYFIHGYEEKKLVNVSQAKKKRVANDRFKLKWLIGINLNAKH